jgi:hypothetical protein
MQYLVGKRVWWELPYDHIAQVKIFTTPIFQLTSLGIGITAPEDLDEAWPKLKRSRQNERKKWGFDITLWTGLSTEPADRIHEAILRCMHRCRVEQGSTQPSDVLT